jgi:NAD(P)-dependent dehydrogenase (short-subunit alcohol dehydrogenase family)
VLELSDFDSVVACAAEVRALGAPIDMLICNAGVLLSELQQVNGIEMQFVVNHLGHFLLTNRLLDRVVAAPQGRVVVVGSMSHRQVPEGGIQFDVLSGEGWVNRAYGHSKLANGLFSLELARRLGGTNATSNSLHPGVVATNPALAGVTGQYFVDCNPEEPSEHQRDTAMDTRLWAVSEDLVRAHLA